MGLTELFQRIADRNRPTSVVESALQNIAAVASPVYGVGAYLNRVLHESGFLTRKRLPAPVLSIGNITLGGTGKTPFCIWLVEMLKAEGHRPAVVSRGYGRDEEASLVVVHDGRTLKSNTRKAGDEPVLLAESLRTTPVIACADRHRAGLLALKKLKADTIVLDDGYQHHILDRQGDIVLVDCTRPLSALRLFPRGTLREALPALQRAHLIVLTRWQQAEHPERVLREVRQAAPAVPVVRTGLKLTGAVRLFDNAHLPVEELKGKKAILVCGVGNPTSVRRSVVEVGIEVAQMRTLSDHARYTRKMILRLDSLRHRLGADYLVVTEKDAVKLRELGKLPPEIIALQSRIQMIDKKDEVVARKVIKARLQAYHGGGIKGLLK